VEQMKASGKESEQGTEQGPQAENIVRGGWSEASPA
jgi:hypothetical protein